MLRPVRGTHHVIRTVVDGEFNVSGSEYWTGLGLFGASPVGEGKTYAYASANDPEVLDAVRRGDLARVVELWSAALPVAAPLLRQIQSIDDLLLNEIGRVRCRRYIDRRAVLIGDAAHAIAPNLGQGANSALVDAAVLAQALSTAPTLADALGRYDEQRRRPVTVGAADVGPARLRVAPPTHRAAPPPRLDLPSGRSPSAGTPTDSRHLAGRSRRADDRRTRAGEIGVPMGRSRTRLERPGPPVTVAAIWR